MVKQTTKSLLIIISSWFFSISVLLVGLLLLITDPIVGLIFLLSSLVLFPPTRKLYQKKVNLRYRYAYSISLALLISAFVVIGLGFKIDDEALASSVSRETPTNLEAKSPVPNVFLEYSCGLAKDILINGEKLSLEQKTALCGGKYNITLSDGINNYEITFLAGEAKYTETVSITFDKSAYEKILADEQAAREKQLKEEEEKRQEDIIKAGEAAKAKLEAQREEKRKTLGYAISGISMKEIREEYDKQKDMSDYKGEKYLDSLAGTKIIWVGKVSNVDDYIVGEGNYIALSLSESLLDFDMGFVDVVKEEDKNLNKGTLIQVSGEISRIDDGILGLSVYIKDVSIEVLE